VCGVAARRRAGVAFLHPEQIAFHRAGPEKPRAGLTIYDIRFTTPARPKAGAKAKIGPYDDSVEIQPEAAAYDLSRRSLGEGGCQRGEKFPERLKIRK
jgi:hypothetical protein